MTGTDAYHYHKCTYPEGVSKTTPVDRFLDGKWVITHRTTAQAVAWLDGSTPEQRVADVARALSANAP